MAVRVTVPLSYERPPLSLNDRMHYMQHARIVREIREEVTLRLRSMRVRRPARHVVVQFHYRPPDRRTRDTDNLVATIKPIVDALTPGKPARRRGSKMTRPTLGYGLVPDDTPQYVTRPEARIHPPNGRGRCWVELTITYEETTP